jgi:hypothetical protein
MMAGLLLSTNGGRTFSAYRSFHDPGGVRLPMMTNGAAIFPSSAHAAVLYLGARGPLLRTADRGRRWAYVRHSARVEQVFWLGFASSRVGAARADSLTLRGRLYVRLTVKRRRQPPERGRVNRGRRRMISA